MRAVPERTAVFAILCAPLLLSSAAVGAQEQPEVPRPTAPPPLGTASFVPPSDIDKQPLTAATFVVRAAITHMTEREIGTLARTHSANEPVKTFGEQLVKDHGVALAQLKQPAADARIALPGEIDAQHQALRDELAGLEGPPFDQKFLAAMVSGHEQAVQLFQAASQSPKLTPALRDYAASILPKVQEHARMARQLQDTL